MNERLTGETDVRSASCYRVELLPSQGIFGRVQTQTEQFTFAPSSCVSQHLHELVTADLI